MNESDMEKKIPFCELVFWLPTFSAKLRDFRPNLPCKIIQMVVISRQTKANSPSYDPSWLRSITQVGVP